ncbi:hypothetical protein SMSP2_01480 [Limihaloglobus sulfuriphilus]|uniref:Glycoside hydrolase 123 catalytic domain-containing protein n=1 Tax=Limihaloglobus sulfuriphilus TaxID=1851148 RepID=A0A1Q2MEI7_9BACT|nr:glycoside hydrolase domain-containing protein [Limihaloglobus sulfuriphilus]AQQ71115.1 hypothetical protein SMSP2_01480 [Limihaloglobus sulfuriphilus]
MLQKKVTFLAVITLVNAGILALEPDIYLSFDHKTAPYMVNGDYGADMVEFASGDNALVPSISAAGVRGSCQDLTNESLSARMQVATYTGSAAAALSSAKSFTTTMWIKGSGTNAGSEYRNGYIWHYRGMNNFIISPRWRTDGKVYLYYGSTSDNTGTFYGGKELASYGQWRFLAISLDAQAGKIRFYAGSETEPVEIIDSFDNSSGALPIISPQAAEPCIFALNTWYDPGTLETTFFMGMYLDELRIFSANDSSAVMSIDQIEQIRQSDLTEYYNPFDAYIGGDIDLSGSVNLYDLFAFGFNWLKTTLAGAFTAGDINADRNVNAVDYGILSKNWQKTKDDSLEILEVDIMDRIFTDWEPRPKSQDVLYHVPRGSHVSFQFALNSDTNQLCRPGLMSVQHSLTGKGMEPEHTFMQGVMIPVEANSNDCGESHPTNPPDPSVLQYLVRQAPYEFSEALKPVNVITIDHSRNNAAVLDILVPLDAPAGLYNARVNFETAAGRNIASVYFAVHNTVVDSSSYTMYLDSWLDPQPKNLCYNTYIPEYWSERHWQLLENSAAVQRKFGENVIFTPLFLGENPAIQITLNSTGQLEFDYTRFDRWILTFKEMGFKLFEGQHLFNRQTLSPTDDIVCYSELQSRELTLVPKTASFSEYSRFLRFALESLYAHLQDKSWTAMFKQHVMDEPNDIERLLQGYTLVKTYMPEVETLDAIHSWGTDPNLYSPNTDIFIFGTTLIDDHQDLVNSRLEQGQKNWMYYFCKPLAPGPNAAQLDHYLTSSRVYPLICHKYNATGLIHWAANRYRGRDPYLYSIGPTWDGQPVTDFGHPPGDNWRYYPSTDGLIPSMRVLNFRDGMTDNELLRMLSDIDQDLASAMLNQVVSSLNEHSRGQFAKYHLLRAKLLEKLDHLNKD